MTKVIYNVTKINIIKIYSMWLYPSFFFFSFLSLLFSILSFFIANMPAVSSYYSSSVLGSFLDGRTAAAAQLLQLCLTLCDPIDCSPPGSSMPGILQVRTLEWFAISFSSACIHAMLLQSCPTLCDPINSSPPVSSVHRIL